MPQPEEIFILSKSARTEDRFERIGDVVHTLERLPIDKSFKVEITEVKRTRSLQQNRYLWGVVYAKIKEHLEGWDAEDIHEYCLGEHFGWEMLEGLGKRRRLRPIKRSSKLSTMEFMDFVDWIIRHMAEKGIDIPLPNEADGWNGESW